MERAITLVVTGKQIAGTLAAAAVLLVGSFWGVNAFMFDGVREGMRDLNGKFDRLVQEDQTTRGLLYGQDAGLRDTIHETREIAAGNAKALDGMANFQEALLADIGSMKSDIREIRDMAREALKR